LERGKVGFERGGGYCLCLPLPFKKTGNYAAARRRFRFCPTAARVCCVARRRLLPPLLPFATGGYRARSHQNLKPEGGMNNVSTVSTTICMVLHVGRLL
jgi:hypothetical protein